MPEERKVVELPNEIGGDDGIEIELTSRTLTAYNEGGHNGVDIDLNKLIDWLWENHPEWMERL